MAQTTQIRNQLKTIIESCFAAELSQGAEYRSDKLHRSLGDEGAYIATSPVSDGPEARHMQTEIAEVLVQYYDRYDLKVDRFQIVDPAAIEEKAARLKAAIRTAVTGGTAGSWTFNVVRTDYLDDPTGNKTRFETYIQGYGNNPSLLETTG